MSTAWMTILGNLIVGIVIAAASALITVRLSLKRFRAERWWERKVSAYTDTLEALHSLKRDIERDIAHTNDRWQPIYSEECNFFEECYPDSINKVRKAADTSSLLLCKDARTALSELLRTLENAESISKGYACKTCGIVIVGKKAVGECMDRISCVAKTDLDIK